MEEKAGSASLVPKEPKERDPRIPVTIITGYLGAGKTTLLKHILTRSKKKIAIIMNEFGDIAIDSKIIQGKNVNIAELSGGCVCCSLTGELEAAIKEVVQKYSPEWIVIETTGVAEPAAIAFDVQKSLPGIRLDAIVTIVDAEAMIRFPSIGHTGTEQIEIADILIMNKIDLVDEKQAEKVRQKLVNITPRAIIAKALRAKVPPEFFFGLNKGHNVHRHKTHKIESEVFIFDEDLTLDREKFLALAKSLPAQIYRSKGFVKCGDASYIFNFVAGRFDFDAAQFDAEKTELVFIGKKILGMEKEIKNKLLACSKR